jgi:catechol 2,3-dioxygenase-like lactoylglutathione lyase family enzyme
MVTSSQLKLASVVMFVKDLAKSIDFYRRLLLLEPTVQNDTAALLVGRDCYQLYLTCIGSGASHSLGGIGYQYVIWTAASDEELLRCETVLRTQSEHVTVTQHQGFRMVEGRDPDDVPVLVTYPGPDEAPRQEIISRIYDW